MPSMPQTGPETGPFQRGLSISENASLTDSYLDHNRQASRPQVLFHIPWNSFNPLCLLDLWETNQRSSDKQCYGVEFSGFRWQRRRISPPSRKLSLRRSEGPCRPLNVE